MALSELLTRVEAAYQALQQKADDRDAAAKAHQAASEAYQAASDALEALRKEINAILSPVSSDPRFRKSA